MGNFLSFGSYNLLIRTPTSDKVPIIKHTLECEFLAFPAQNGDHKNVYCPCKKLLEEQNISPLFTVLTTQD